MSLKSFGHWLYATPASAALRDATWVIPTIQIIHILSVAVLAGSALISNLRLAGLFAADEPSSTVFRRYLPWMGGALVALLLSGLVLIFAEPDRTLGNAVFWTKMALIVAAFAITLIVQNSQFNPSTGSHGSVAREKAKSVAWLSLALWTAVICCGRFIAYS